MAVAYVGDIGTKIEFDIGVDVNDVETALLIIRYPSGDRVTRDLKIDTENNVLYYVTQTDDLKEAGIYQLQARVNLKSGWSGSSEIVKMEVLDIL